MPKLFDVFTRKIYEENGDRKVRWYKVGYLKETGKTSKYLVLFHQPDTPFYILENESGLKQIPF